ncbi:sensor histidine kinase [Anaerosalibacter massiliensis]|uniref:GHKL domain-containing protein n=1 Tax=Anaerosalibacter massiliensis TaxID=1347392 RepID=A0A9X2MGF2_9FIRM|nr:GHKL domain-containing protein [Anaerosalibacter massiliensis]MCR2044587.1 GHKL domain-containing protein [Anaerosalibacter massiliensis]
MNLVELIIISVFDIVEYVIISNKLINYNKIDKFLATIYILGASIITGISGRYISMRCNFLIGGFLICCIICLLYDIKIIETIYVYVLSTIIIISIQLFSIVLLKVFLGNINYEFVYAMISEIISLIMVIFIVNHIPINLMFKFVMENNKVFKTIILNILVLLVAILLYWHMDISGFLKNIIIMAVFSAGIIYVNLVFIKEGLKNEQDEKQLRKYEDYLPIIDELIDEIRRRQHEFDNHVQALRMLTITSTDYESIVNSMNNYMDDLKMDNNLIDLIKLDNKVLAGFLYSKIKSAEKLGINFNIIIEDYGFKTKLKDYELIEIVGNLINNGFETKVADNIIILKLKKEKNMDVMELKNKHPYLDIKSINKMFKLGSSTKSNSGRGYGLYNIKDLVKKYNGKIEIFNDKMNEENYIVFRVLFVRNGLF